VAFEPDGHNSVYAKCHRLMPFEAKFPPGTAPGLLGEGEAMVICKDMDFPDTIRKDAHAGLRLMAVPAWDSDADAWIHARMAVLRGVENGFAVARAASHGLLTASDANGRLIAQKVARPEQMDWILADLPLGPGPTLYTRIGNVFPWATLGLTLLLCVVGMSANGDLSDRFGESRKSATGPQAALRRPLIRTDSAPARRNGRSPARCA